MSVEIHTMKNSMHTRQLKAGQLALLTQLCHLKHPAGEFRLDDTGLIVQKFDDNLQVVGSTRRWIDHFCNKEELGFACTLLNKGDTMTVKGNQ